LLALGRSDVLVGSQHPDLVDLERNRYRCQEVQVGVHLETAGFLAGSEGPGAQIGVEVG